VSHQLSFEFAEQSSSDLRITSPKDHICALERRFDTRFVARLATKEKQIQQNYRPVIGIHKWFARRPGTVFRNLLLAEYNGPDSLQTDYWRAHEFEGIIADPFMGGGTPIFEAIRLGFSVVGADINPMAFWIVRQSLAPLDLDAYRRHAIAVIREVEQEVADFYLTTCQFCGGEVPVKYFLWVKTQACPVCGVENDLFPGYLLAAAERHPKHVVACHRCGELNEFDHKPHIHTPAVCATCGGEVYVDGPAKKNRSICSACGHAFSYPAQEPAGPPKHRLWAIEYHCEQCRPGHNGRFFKRPDSDDFRRLEKAEDHFGELEHVLPIPTERIPEGDETKRLHRWGYRYFREMFNHRQLLGLGQLLRRIALVEDSLVRHALLTVFSDFLRYQNMLARYDTFALKCQDIFSVHGFPVGLVQCENNLIGIPRVGSGAFRHFLDKYRRAKEYCKQPFETRHIGKRKKTVPISGEKLEAKFVDQLPSIHSREAWINCRSAEMLSLPPNSLDGVFTDPPYFDNVQYAELMDFCYVWLKMALRDEFSAFQPGTTRNPEELTGNDTMRRCLDHFTGGLSRIFQRYASALKAGAPFVFTFHHNDLEAYVPLVVAILDAGLDCTAALPAPAEMGASLHIARTKSSVLDSVFICRRITVGLKSIPIKEQLEKDLLALNSAGIQVTAGDIRCLVTGHVARVAVNRLRATWNSETGLGQRMSASSRLLRAIGEEIDLEDLIRSHRPEIGKQKREAHARATAI
jgi:hypothetical protein